MYNINIYYNDFTENYFLSLQVYQFLLLGFFYCCQYNQNNKASNLGITNAVNNGSTAEFYLRSMIASSGHTMEYVGSGTDYNALPENGGVPDETRQITELNEGKIWAVTVDHKGKLKAGEDFAVDQETGAVLLGTGALAIPTLITNLDTNGKTITDGQGDIQIGPESRAPVLLFSLSL